MTDRPILFSALMVRALLQGRKTQTRRLLPNPEYYGCPTGDCPHERQDECNLAMKENTAADLRFAVGDRLWVKETWRTLQKWDCLKPSHLADDIDKIDYAANGYGRNPLWAWGKTRVSIFMPRWASRITLTVTDVRVERLQDISQEDAQAEGIYFDKIGFTAGHIGLRGCNQEWAATPAIAYANLWRHINGPGAWEANPWIVVVTFTVESRNIDG